ncbi:PiggyBac transposable element-derived protein 4 [Elysia marginata]|uniref:PiggyBac transposable element-derived protein 4 n=1 Tax=Elysia marginata TaxID=1093978 RepID=A0AAV4IU00_9GAST|nr:PiggyBac transposable element-derived protein 4 [Elysia marginata]
MTRTRFQDILSQLHLSDNKLYIPPDQDNHYTPFKIRFILNHLKDKFQELYTPNILETIIEEDELRLVRFLLSNTCLNIRIGGTKEEKKFTIYAAEKGLSNRPTDVCLRLLTPLHNQGYWLFTDNYYTCPELTTRLLALKTMSVGTVRSNCKGLPKDLVKETLKTGDIVYRRKGPMVALRWKDKQDVTLLTTVHNPTRKVTVTTRSQVKEKPLVVQEYTTSMSGVDMKDQLLAYLPLARSTIKWCKRLFMHMMTLTVIQSHILHNKLLLKNGKPRLKLKQFIISLSTDMTKKFLAEREKEAPNPAKRVQPGQLGRLTERHFLDYLPPTACKSKPRRDCTVCTERHKANPQQVENKRTETYFWCVECETPLCPGKCFRDFHTKDLYWL